MENVMEPIIPKFVGQQRLDEIKVKFESGDKIETNDIEWLIKTVEKMSELIINAEILRQNKSKTK